MTRVPGQLIWSAFLSVIILQAGLLSYFILHPIAFQWANVIRPGERPELTVDKNRFLDARAVVGRIPYHSTAQVYAVNPPDRYQRTLVEGNGNCSNFVNGLAYLLASQEVPFQIVHFFRTDGFLDGIGHSVLNVPYQLDSGEWLGIIDIAEGGIPMKDGKPLTVADLASNGLRGVIIEPLNPRQDSFSDYYGSFLGASVIGIVDGGATTKYFKTLERLYVPLGNRQLETYFYRGLAIVLGVYPPIVVTPPDYKRLFGDHMVIRTAGRTLALLLRLDAILILAIPVITFIWLKRRRVGHHSMPIPS